MVRGDVGSSDHRMARCFRRVIGAMAVASVVMLVAPLTPAGAATLSVGLTQANWYWREQPTNIAGSGVSPPAALVDPTVPAGDLAVSGPEANGRPDKESYLMFDMSAIPAGATITSFQLRLPVDPAGTNSTLVGVQPPVILCSPQGSWSAGPGAQPFSAKPGDSCPAGAPKLQSNDGGKTYVADLTAIAQGWIGPAAMNLGVAVTDDPHNTSTAYQVVFGPASAITELRASVTYAVSAPVSAPVAATPAAPATEGPATATSPSAATSAGAPGTSGLAAPAPPLASAVPPVSGSGLASPGPATAAGSPAASTGPLAPTPATASPAAATSRVAGTSSVPEGWFWLAGALLTLLLLVVSLVIGNTAPGVRDVSVGRDGIQRPRQLARRLGRGAAR